MSGRFAWARCRRCFALFIFMMYKIKGGSLIGYSMRKQNLSRVRTRFLSIISWERSRFKIFHRLQSKENSSKWVSTYFYFSQSKKKIAVLGFKVFFVLKLKITFNPKTAIFFRLTELKVCRYLVWTIIFLLEWMKSLESTQISRYDRRKTYPSLDNFW